jgi:hypothetical protein
MSFGIAGRMGDEEKGDELIHNADAALFHAKLRGRNGALIYSEEGFFNGVFRNEQNQPVSPDPEPVEQPERETPGDHPAARLRRRLRSWSSHLYRRMLLPGKARPNR